MVLILDGNLDLVCTKGAIYVIWTVECIIQKAVRIDFFSPKRHIFLHTFAICSELPANISTIVKTRRSKEDRVTICWLLFTSFIRHRFLEADILYKCVLHSVTHSLIHFGLNLNNIALYRNTIPLSIYLSLFLSFYVQILSSITYFLSFSSVSPVVFILSGLFCMTGSLCINFSVCSLYQTLLQKSALVLTWHSSR